MRKLQNGHIVYIGIDRMVLSLLPCYSMHVFGLKFNSLFAADFVASVYIHTCLAIDKLIKSKRPYNCNKSTLSVLLCNQTTRIIAVVDELQISLWPSMCSQHHQWYLSHQKKLQRTNWTSLLTVENSYSPMDNEYHWTKQLYRYLIFPYGHTCTMKIENFPSALNLQFWPLLLCYTIEKFILPIGL